MEPFSRFLSSTVACIESPVADHLEMFFRDMPDEPLDEFHSGQGLFYVRVIFMAVVMERDSLSVITVNTGGCNHRPSKISADIFDHGIRVAFVGFCINIEPVFVLFVTECFCFLKGGADFGFHFIQEGGAESIAQIVVVKIIDCFPKIMITEAALGNKAVDTMTIFT